MSVFSRASGGEKKLRKEEEGPPALSCVQSPTLLALPSELVPFLIFILQHHLREREGRRKNNAESVKLKIMRWVGKATAGNVQRERVWRRTRRWPSWRRSCPPARPVSALSRPELSEHGRVPPRHPTPLPSCPPCPPGRGCAGPGSWRPSRKLFRRLRQRHQADIRVRKKK